MSPTSSPSSSVPAEVLDAVVAAAAAAAARLPSPEPLVPGAPSTDLAAAPLPADVAAAVCSRLSGAVRGEAAVLVAADLVAALRDSPLGELELVPAVQPALEAAAGTFGQVVAEPGRELAPDLALDGLQGAGLAVVVPLLAGGPGGPTRAAFAAVVTAPPRSPTIGRDLGPGSPGQVPGQASRRAGLELLRDVEMEVTAELGRTRMTVWELLSLAPGAVVELDRAAGSPADLLVNGTLIARGEVVVVDEDFGIRITEIVVPATEREGTP